MSKHHFLFLLSIFHATLSFGLSLAPPEQPTACREPARTVCINSCISDFCRAACEQNNCGAEVPEWIPPNGSWWMPGPAPVVEEGFPDLNLTDVACDNGLSDTMKDTIIPVYKENNLLDTYKIVFKAWGCELKPY